MAAEHISGVRLLVVWSVCDPDEGLGGGFSSCLLVDPKYSLWTLDRMGSKCMGHLMLQL